MKKGFVEDLLKWYHKEKRELPWRENTTPYRVWVSEIMLQQTRVEAVKPYYHRFMKELPTIDALANLDQMRLLKLWEGLGYYNRVKNMQKAAKLIMEKYNGIFPKEYAEVIRLPGIGEYTAGAICSICYGMPVPAVDGNVLRVISRVEEYPNDIKENKSKEDITRIVSTLYTKENASELTQALMELGATICTPKESYTCALCPINKSCNSYKHSTQNIYPIVSKKKDRKLEYKTVFILCYEDKIGVNVRKENNVLKGMYEFLNIENKLKDQEVVNQLEIWDIPYHSIVRLEDTKHIFTHKEWDMSVYKVMCNNMHPSLEWYTKDTILNQLPMPTAFKKIFHKL